ncbi:hypothetical protein [Pandoraea bronchicola]|nr:hypothetical protein [Pandoraea bronchicola]
MTPLTYKDLTDEQARQVQLHKVNEQTAANRATALRKFLSANKVGFEDVVGPEMRERFPDAIERFIKTLQDEGRTPRAISNTRAALRPWRDAVIHHDTIVAVEQRVGTPFVLALKGVLGDLPVGRVAKQAGIPSDMLRGWLIGKQPRGSNAQYILRFERFFGLEHESMVVLAGVRQKGQRTASDLRPAENQYNGRMFALTRQPYCAKPSENSPLRKQWYDYVRYKTSAVPMLKRTKRGKWRISPCPVHPETDANWWAFLDGKEVASARIAWAGVSSYLGWLALPEESGGKNIPADQLQTLAWLTAPEFLESYLDWMKERIGVRNQKTTQFLAFIASLVRPKFGYLWQSEKLLTTLPGAYSSDTWQALCERQLELTEQLTSAYHGEIEVSRDSFEPIRSIVQLSQPMEAMVDMIARMRANRPVGGAPSIAALWSRDMALIKLLLSNPLRKRNVAHLTWRADNTGELYQRGDGSWWIRIPKSKFKNRNGAAGDSVYDCGVQQSAWRDIESYLLVHRPVLLQFPSDLVFLTRVERGATSHRPWEQLGAQVHTLTARYIPESGGFGVHAFRHIVATSILKADGGTHKTAARVLNDRVATVEKHYDGLTSNDGTEQMTRLLNAQFSRM